MTRRYEGGTEVDRELSVEVLLDALPLTTVVLKTTGQVIAATPSFWQTIGVARPDSYPVALPANSLTSTLLALSSQGNGDQGHHTYRGAEGDVGIAWRSLPLASGSAMVACLTSGPHAATPTETLPTDQAPGVCDDLPNPKATEALLEQAVAMCQQEHLPLSVALLCMTHNNGQPLRKVDDGLWSSIARRLRALCRITDLLGVSPSGDILIILVGATLPQAKIVTHRIMACFDEWTAVNTVLQPTKIRYVTWLPDDGKVSATKLLTALDVQG